MYKSWRNMAQRSASSRGEAGFQNLEESFLDVGGALNGSLTFLEFASVISILVFFNAEIIGQGSMAADKVSCGLQAPQLTQNMK